MATGRPFVSSPVPDVVTNFSKVVKVAEKHDDFIKACHYGLRLTETGRVRWYASGLAIGSALFVVFIWLAR